MAPNVVHNIRSLIFRMGPFSSIIAVKKMLNASECKAMRNPFFNNLDPAICNLDNRIVHAVLMKMVNDLFLIFIAKLAASRGLFKKGGGEPLVMKPISNIIS